MNLKDLIKLADQQGRVVVVGEDGEVKGVFLSYSDFEKLSGEVATIKPQLDPEKINREILEAQLKDTVDLGNKNLEIIDKIVQMPTPIQDILSRRVKDLFVSHPYGRQEAPEYDLRQEVMDPSFGQPVVESDSEEEIKPNFDDI